MFKKIITKWKEEWWEKRADELAREYTNQEAILKQEFTEHLEKDRMSFNAKLDELSMKAREVESRIAVLEIKKDELSELERRIEDKKVELVRINEELREQIRIAEAKSSPSNVFTEAFALGVSKTWDMLIPVLTGNIETMKKKIYEDATSEAIERMKKGKR